MIHNPDTGCEVDYTLEHGHPLQARNRNMWHIQKTQWLLILDKKTSLGSNPGPHIFHKSAQPTVLWCSRQAMESSIIYYMYDRSWCPHPADKSRIMLLCCIETDSKGSSENIFISVWSSCTMVHTHIFRVICNLIVQDSLYTGINMWKLSVQV